MRLINLLNLGKTVQKHPIQALILTIISPLTYYWSVGQMGHSPMYMAGKMFFYLLLSYFWTCIMLSVTDWIEALSTLAGKVLRTIILATTIVIFAVDIFLLFKFDAILDQAKISIVLGTNPYTVCEFFLDYVLSPLSILAALIIVGLITIVYRHKPQMTFAIPQKFYKLPVYLFILSTVVFFSFCGFKHIHSWQEFLDTQVHATSSINRVLVDTYRAWTAFGNEEEIFAAMDNNPEAIIENKSDIPYVIIVLGESADRNKMHGYGYALETTPYLDSLLSRGEAVPFTDAIAPANFTSVAMEYIFTFYSKDSQGKWYEYQNLVDILSKSGYNTTWISNQSPQNINGNMDEILAKRSDVAKFTNYSAGPARPYDEEIIPLLDDCLSQSDAPKQFFVIHIEGSHDVYKMRYPSTFDKFTANDEQEPNPKWAATKAEYDNSVLYTDYLMEQIIKRFSDKECLLIYLSDHGSEVYDGRDFCGHSGEELRNRHMVETPLIIWGSKKFWAKRPELKQRALYAKDKPFMNDYFIHFLLDLTGIRTTSYEPGKSVINEHYNEKRVRMYGGQPYEK